MILQAVLLGTIRHESPGAQMQVILGLWFSLNSPGEFLLATDALAPSKTN